jgi:hypothetical protein
MIVRRSLGPVAAHELNAAAQDRTAASTSAALAAAAVVTTSPFIGFLRSNDPPAAAGPSRLSIRSPNCTAAPSSFQGAAQDFKRRAL